MGASIFLGGGIKSFETLYSTPFPNSISPVSELNLYLTYHLSLKSTNTLSTSFGLIPTSKAMSSNL